MKRKILSVVLSLLVVITLLPTGIMAANISYGMTSDEVLAVQTRLQELGYSVGALDGYFGSVTEAAVYSFQQDYGLVVDGWVGDQTYAALFGGNSDNSNTTSTAAAETSSVPAGFTRDLYYGITGDDVLAVQKKLTELGYSLGPLDGYFGAMTENAVYAFQEDHGLAVDGWIGICTYNALFSTSSGSTSQSTTEQTAAPAEETPATVFTRDLYYGLTGDDVLALQQKLTNLGYSLGALDGYFGTMTENAVKQFQRINNLYVDGLAGQVTFTKLENNPVAYSAASDAASYTSEVESLAKAVLDQVGWDLYAAFEWSVGITHDINLDIGYSNTQTAIYSFKTRYGNCISMASTFYWMAKLLGYEAYVIEGSVPYASGGYGEHAWVEIVVGGTTYVCDPDFEMQMGRNGYMINYGQSGTWKYVYGYRLSD